MASDDITIEPNEHFDFAAYQHGTYDDTSILAGQPKRTFLDGFDYLEDALAKYPDATVLDCSTKVDMQLPQAPPDWFDPADAGEAWHEDDY